METLSIFIFIIIGSALALLLYKQFTKAQNRPKTSSLTKNDIILRYEKMVNDLLEENKELPREELLQRKGQLLKHISRELHNNIYFDDEEAKEIVKKLAAM